MLELRLDNANDIDIKYKEIPDQLNVFIPEFHQLIQYLMNRLFGLHLILKA